ncbi:hypothetical protein Q5O14_02685 [Eubacteriaceae bacterium ES2]|nr:hypothetical protein Q5O14_02685 [Eubacteriaceae bacterium ES2]
MSIEKKINLYLTLLNSLFYGVIFTILGGLITTGAVDWPHFPVTVLVGAVVGIIVGLVVPLGKWAQAVADKVSTPGKFLYNLAMNVVILIIMLVFMCPVFTVFIGSVLYGAPVLAVLPGSFTLFLPFFGIGLVLATIFGGLILKLALKLAGVPDTQKEN